MQNQDFVSKTLKQFVCWAAHFEQTSEIFKSVTGEVIVESWIECSDAVVAPLQQDFQADDCRTETGLMKRKQKSLM